MGKLIDEYNPQQPLITGVFTWNSYVALKKYVLMLVNFYLCPIKKIMLIKTQNY